jgi:hypothetical protein
MWRCANDNFADAFVCTYKNYMKKLLWAQAHVVLRRCIPQSRGLCVPSVYIYFCVICVYVLPPKLVHKTRVRIHSHQIRTHMKSSTGTAWMVKNLEDGIWIHARGSSLRVKFSNFESIQLRHRLHSTKTRCQYRMNVRIYVCMYVCMYVYTHIHNALVHHVANVFLSRTSRCMPRHTASYGVW